MEQFEIKSDALGVIERIKEINNKYSVFYNLKKNKFELYLTEAELKPKRYCLTFPYNVVDERMITCVLKSEIQNREAVLREIEKHNEKLLKQSQKDCLNSISQNIG